MLSQVSHPIPAVETETPLLYPPEDCPMRVTYNAACDRLTWKLVPGPFVNQGWA